MKRFFCSLLAACCLLCVPAYAEEVVNTISLSESQESPVESSQEDDSHDSVEEAAGSVEPPMEGEESDSVADALPGDEVVVSGDADDVGGAPASDDEDSDYYGDSYSMDGVTQRLDDIYDLLSEPGVLIEEYSYPSNAPLSGGYYIEADTSAGDAILYIPKEYQEGSLTTNSQGNIVNITAGTISGVVFIGNGSFDLRIPSFETPEYRDYSSSSSWDWKPLNVSEVQNTNVQIIVDGNSVPLYPPIGVIGLLVIFLLGVIVCRLFLMR